MRILQRESVKLRRLIHFKKSLNFSCKKVDTHGNKPYFYIIIKKERYMKKAAKVEYGIQIVKPWSNEMYDHNDIVAEVVRIKVKQLWIAALMQYQKEFDGNDQMLESDWVVASTELKRIQTAITCYGFGYGYDVNQVVDRVMQELDDAPYYRLNEMVEELELELEKGFVGL